MKKRDVTRIKLEPNYRVRLVWNLGISSPTEYNSNYKTIESMIHASKLVSRDVDSPHLVKSKKNLLHYNIQISLSHQKQVSHHFFLYIHWLNDYMPIAIFRQFARWCGDQSLGHGNYQPIKRPTADWPSKTGQDCGPLYLLTTLEIAYKQ